jgi:hypothetical protein
VSDELHELKRAASQQRRSFVAARAGYSEALGQLRLAAAVLGDVEELLRQTHQADLDVSAALGERGELLLAARRAGASNDQIQDALGTLAEGYEALEALLRQIDAQLAREEREIRAAVQQASPEPPRPYTHVIGRAVPHTVLNGPHPDPECVRRHFERLHDQPVDLELPADLASVERWPAIPLDSHRGQQWVAGALQGGAYELLPCYCTDKPIWPGTHGALGQHGWGSSGGHTTYDLAYSLLRLRYGRPFKLGWMAREPSVEACLFPGLLEVIRRLPDGASWRIDWERLGDVAIESSRR